MEECKTGNGLDPGNNSNETQRKQTKGAKCSEIVKIYKNAYN